MYPIEDTATYGEQLITLTTCDYYTENGRFVVVAKKVNSYINTYTKNNINLNIYNTIKKILKGGVVIE